MVYGHPLLSIQHPLEDPGIYVYMYFVYMFFIYASMSIIRKPILKNKTSSLLWVCGTFALKTKADGGHYVGWTLHKKADGKDLKDRQGRGGWVGVDSLFDVDVSLVLDQPLRGLWLERAAICWRYFILP